MLEAEGREMKRAQSGNLHLVGETVGRISGVGDT
jgi:hypothetical protein